MLSLSNQVSKLEKNVEILHAKKTQAPVEEKQYDYKLQYYLNDFVYAYFTLLKKLKSKKDRLTTSIAFITLYRM